MNGRVGSRAHKEKEKVGVGNEGLQFEKIVGQWNPNRAIIVEQSRGERERGSDQKHLPRAISEQKEAKAVRLSTPECSRAAISLHHYHNKLITEIRGGRGARRGGGQVGFATLHTGGVRGNTTQPSATLATTERYNYHFCEELSNVEITY